MSPQQEITTILHHAMGFDAAALSDSAVERAMRKRMAQCGQRDESAYLVYLRASPLELSQLIEEVVVPETWFFRDGKPFEVLQRHVMDEWLVANPERPLRILSVPCSSGEEPYSAVMALLDAGLPPERISAEGVDISSVALGKARRGLYGRNSFRGATPALQERYFTATPNGWQLHEQVRKLVYFAQGNLLANDFSLLRGGYDVIFCRNLLIYFDETNRERALSMLEKLLLPQGVLFVGHAESAPVLGKFFAPIVSPQAFAYRKKSCEPLPGKRKSAVKPQRDSRRTTEIPRPSETEKPVGRMRAPAQDVAATAKAAPEKSIEQAQALADQGRLAEAAALCETYLHEHGASAPAYYLLGLVHDAGNAVENARECFVKAVYLEPDHYEALAHLALLAERQGDVGSATLLRQRAQRAQLRRGNK